VALLADEPDIGVGVDPREALRGSAGRAVGVGDGCGRGAAGVKAPDPSSIPFVRLHVNRADAFAVLAMVALAAIFLAALLIGDPFDPS
jgi:hypothetical protein